MHVLCVWVLVCAVDSSVDISRSKMEYMLSDILGKEKHDFESYFTEQLGDVGRLKLESK